MHVPLSDKHLNTTSITVSGMLGECSDGVFSLVEEARGYVDEIVRSNCMPWFFN